MNGDRVKFAKELNEMNTAGTKERSTTAKTGWGILFGLNALLVLNGAGLYTFIATEGSERTTSLLLIGMALFGLSIAQEGLRLSSRTAWKRSWITAAVLLALALNIAVFGEMYVAVFYFFMTGIALLGLFLAGREKA
jgi:cation transport ATPase